MAPIQSTADAFGSFLPSIRIPYLGRLGSVTQKTILIGLACFGAYKILKPFYDRYAPKILAEAYGWQLVEDPGSIKKAARIVQAYADRHIQKLQQVIKNQKPNPIDGLARAIACACPAHTEAGHFYNELKGHIFRILIGIEAVAGGSAARALNTTSDAAATVGNGAASLISLFPILGTSVAGGMRAAVQGLALSTESAQWQALCRAAKLCSDSQDIALAAQLIAAHITSRCAEAVVMLSEKGSADLALHTADCFRRHILYEWNIKPKAKDSSSETPTWSPLDLAFECQKISLAIQGRDNETELAVKEVLKELTKVWRVAHILKLGIAST